MKARRGPSRLYAVLSIRDLGAATMALQAYLDAGGAIDAGALTVAVVDALADSVEAGDVLARLAFAGPTLSEETWR